MSSDFVERLTSISAFGFYFWVSKHLGNASFLKLAPPMPFAALCVRANACALGNCSVGSPPVDSIQVSKNCLFAALLIYFI
jgi:hypothetical protein